MAVNVGTAQASRPEDVKMILEKIEDKECGWSDLLGISSSGYGSKRKFQGLTTALGVLI